MTCWGLLVSCFLLTLDCVFSFFSLFLVGPWGRFVTIRKHLLVASKPVSEGGTGKAEQFWEWSEEQVRPYL